MPDTHPTINSQTRTHSTMTTLSTHTHFSPPPPSPTSPTSPPSPPTTIPPFLYRVHHPSAQTRYTFSTGFSAKNQTTILNYLSALSRFGLAHLHHQTNISSPFISAYDSLAHAEKVARHFAHKYGEDTRVVTLDTSHLARGPVFRAADLLKQDNGMGKVADEWLHWGEYLVMYRVPPQAVRVEMEVVRAGERGWMGVGVIGRPGRP